MKAIFVFLILASVALYGEAKEKNDESLATIKNEAAIKNEALSKNAFENSNPTEEAEGDEEFKFLKSGKKVNDITFKKLPKVEFWQGSKFKQPPHWIVVHYTAMPGVGAERCTKSFDKKRTSRKVSTHFFCDSKEVYSVVDEEHVAWHVGNGNVAIGNKSLKQIAKYGDVKDWRYKLAAENHMRWKEEGEDFRGNFYSYGVDLCCLKENAKKLKVKDQDWYFAPETIVNGAKTVAYLCKKHNIPLEHVIRHGDATGKPCPRPFVSLPGDTDPTKNDQRWEEFKAMVAEYL